MNNIPVHRKTFPTYVFVHKHDYFLLIIKFSSLHHHRLLFCFGTFIWDRLYLCVCIYMQTVLLKNVNFLILLNS